MGPTSFAVGSISTWPPAKTPGRISRPSGSLFIRACSRSAFARLYSSIDPTSVQYPSATYPKSGSPSARSCGNRSLLKSNFSPMAKRSSTRGSMTYMPVLIVSENTSPHEGFSRNFEMRPSGWVMTTPYSSGFATRTSVSVTTACSGPMLGGCRGLFGSDGEQGLEVVAGVHLERDVRVGAHDAGDLADPAGHDVGELVVLALTDHRDEVHRTGDRVDLGHAVD